MTPAPDPIVLRRAAIAALAGGSVVVVGLERTGVVDASRSVELESAADQLRRHHRFVIITGPLPAPCDLVTLNPHWKVPPPHRSPA